MKTLHIQYHACGKPNCHCQREGKLHGPYLYAYKRRSNGLLRTVYLRKATQVDVERWRLERAGITP